MFTKLATDYLQSKNEVQHSIQTIDYTFNTF